VETDDDGRFELDVSPAEDRRYVINVEKLGYVPISKIHIGTAIGQLDLTLQQAQRFDIEPQEPIKIEDKRGTQIIIEPGSLVDARGNPAEGPLQLLMHTYDLASEEMVGNMSGINRDGRLVSMVSFGAFYADFIDEEGNAYNLAEGAEAIIVVPANQTVESPDVVPLWSYNMEEGLWIEEGEAVLEGEQYVGVVSHFSVWNFDVEFYEPACIQITIDPDYLAANSPVEVKAVLLSPMMVKYLYLTSVTNVVVGLPAYTDVEFYIPPTAPTPFAIVNTGAPWGGPGLSPPFPYDECNGNLHIDFEDFEEMGDLGDAPDSTNHFGTPMSPYPTIFATTAARYPTVFDVNSPDAPGPKHWLPREDAWLGKYVSLEYDADLPGDEDGITNIVPPNDEADLDHFDDGVRLETVQIPQCGLTTFDFDVHVPSGAILGTSERFVNVWFDYNRDGDWEDILECETENGNVIGVTEWSVQNHIIVVGPGYHTLPTPDFEAMNPPYPDYPMWMRITLSESEAPLTPQSGFDLADGRGPDSGYEVGETEDYYLNEYQEPIPPDLTIQKVADPQIFEVGETGIYVLEVTNIGTGPTTGPTWVTDTLPNGIVPINVTVSPASTCSPTITCMLPAPIAPGDVYTIIIEVDVTDQAEQVVENCADVKAEGESDYTNNESCVETEVLAKAIYVSSSTGGNVSGIPFRDEDILAFNPGTGGWAMYFDGSDVGLQKWDVNAFHVFDNGDILMSFNKPKTIGGITYDDSDIVHFAATSLGTTTSGTFSMYLDGSDVLLTTNGEDIDAIGFEPGGDLVISTLGTAKVGFTARDEDLIRFDAISFGSSTSGTWHRYFDGSDVGLTASTEDVWATWIDSETREIHLSTLGNYSIPGPLTGDSDDVFICSPSSLGSNTNCTFSLFWNGDLHGYGSEKIDGYSVGPMPTGLVFSASVNHSNETDAYTQGSDATKNDTADDDVLDDDEVTMQVYLPMISH